MIRSKLLSAIALAVAAGWCLPASAQTADPAAIQQELAAMRAQIQAMAQRVETLEGQLAEAREKSAAAASPPVVAQAAPTATAKPATDIAWEGAPKFTGKDGWSFKPRGRVHFDAGVIGAPGALETRNLGTNLRARRARLGFEGTVPGGFGFKVEADFASGGVVFGDTLASWAPAKAPLLVRIGNFETLNGMEQITSSNNVTFLERAAFNDAFLNTRRLGAAVALRGGGDDWRAELGLFTAHGIDGSFDNDGWIGAARLVYAPKAMGGQLHFGANYQHRDFASNNGGVASAGTGTPSINQLARYRARPNSQLTDVRFIDTGSFAARSDTILGIEAAAIFKRLYITGEAQWLKADGYAAGATASGISAFASGNAAVVPASDPGFFGVYGEIGYFFTGETRNYRRGEGIWGRTKVRNPITKGGSGAFQLAARYEHVDLDDGSLVGGLTNNFTTGATSLAADTARLGRGGTQSSYLLGLNWYPVDYIRFMVNYARIEVTGGPLAAQVLPLSADPVDRRGYGTNLLQTRLQLDF